MAAADGSSSSSAYTHDVFLSFRGPDTGNSFTIFLYDYLKKEGIAAYLDREDLRAGEIINSALIKAIQGSKISIPVFSKGYADSRWCLEELVEIVRCHQQNHQIIIPIFYDVKPTVVRHQTESYDVSFRTHRESFDDETTKSWKTALKVVAGISGYDVDNGVEQILVERVVGRVLSEIIPNRLSDIKYPVGLHYPDGPVQNLSSLLNLDSNDVQFWGICGIGGIGKTAIAKTLYNKICKNFPISCFLANIREEASRPNGIVYLQEQLLSIVCKKRVGTIWNVDSGKQRIKRRLRGEKVLLVFDDMHHPSQLNDLAIEFKLFGLGSRIIITSRDEHMLNLAKVEEGKIYWPKKLDDDQSLELFSWHTFSKERPPQMYERLSREVILFARGLPLTLEVLGSSFVNIKEEDVCQSMLQRFERIPHMEVHKRLKLSYKILDDDEKSVFLDAACFFVGWKIETVISIWKACGFQPTSIIKKLLQKSLLNSSDCGDELSMHEEIQAMGRGIVYEESPIRLEMRSRLWHDDDILDVLKEHKGTRMIEGIIPRSNDLFSRVCLKERDFKMMFNLRILYVDGASYEGINFPRFPSSLIWFRWRRCPLKILPSNFYLSKVIHMDLTGSQIRKAWIDPPQSEYQKFQNLKVLCLRHCNHLTQSPDFSRFPCLETLDLGRCRKLVDLDPSIGVLTSLVNICLDETRIDALPDTICKLRLLQRLTLQSCSLLQNLPESIGDLESLVMLSLDGTGIEVLPDSICRLNSLQSLTLARCSSFRALPDEIGGLPSLIELSLVETKIKQLPVTFHMLNSLRDLNLSWCSSLQGLPYSIGDLQSLEKLNLNGCVSLNTLPESITYLSPTVQLSMRGTNLLLSNRVRFWLLR